MTKPYQRLSQHPASLHLIVVWEVEVQLLIPENVEIRSREVSPTQSRTRVNLGKGSPLAFARSGRVRMTKLEWPLMNGMAVDVTCPL